MNSTYLGNFIIDESNVEQYDNNLNNMIITIID